MSSRPEPPAANQTAIPWGRLLLWFAATRLVMFGLAGLTMTAIRHGPFFDAGRGPIDWFLQWDSRWYLDIAQSGYSYDPQKMSSVNFLPLYPILVRAVAFLVRNAKIAGYLVSNVFCLGSAGLLWRLARDVDQREDIADGATVFFLAGPVAVFFSTLYSESVFLFFGIAAVLAARRSRWLTAGLCGAAAALTRSVGVVLVVPLVVEFLRAHRTAQKWRRSSAWIGFSWCGLPILATGLYAAYLGWRFGDPMAYIVSQRHSGHAFGRPWEIFARTDFSGLSVFYQYWFGAAAVLALILVLAGVLQRIPASLTALAVALTGLYLSVSTLEALPRFLSVIFPFYLVVGRLHVRCPSVGTVLVAASAALMSMSVILFVNGYWFT